jgi:hypothetical protein
MLQNIKRILGIVSATIILLALSACGSNVDTAAVPIEIEVEHEAADNYIYELEPNGEADRPAEIQHVSWQEAYAEILWQYAELPLDYDIWVGFDWGWNFILHDINHDNIPELILVMRYFTGHVGIYSVYTFTNNEVISLEFDEVMGEVGLFALPNNNPGIVFSQLAGSGAIYSKMGIEGNTLSIVVRGFHHLSEEGFEKQWELLERELDFEDSYEWRVLTINDEPATVEEFEYMFGAWDWGKNWLRDLPITEYNIRNGVLGWTQDTRFFDWHFAREG